MSSSTWEAINSLMLLQRNKSSIFLGVSALKYSFRLKSCLFPALTAFNLLHSKTSTGNLEYVEQPPLPTCNSWNFKTLKRFQICISADATNKRKIRFSCSSRMIKRIFFKIFFFPIRKHKSEGMGTNPLPKKHRGHRNNHWAHCASCSHNLQNKLAWNDKTSSLSCSVNRIKMKKIVNDYFGLLLHWQ